MVARADHRELARIFRTQPIYAVFSQLKAKSKRTKFSHNLDPTPPVVHQGERRFQDPRPCPHIWRQILLKVSPLIFSRNALPARGGCRNPSSVNLNPFYIVCASHMAPIPKVTFSQNSPFRKNPSCSELGFFLSRKNLVRRVSVGTI